jgi:hypothetical protein
MIKLKLNFYNIIIKISWIEFINYKEQFCMEKKKTIHDQYIWSVYCITDKLDKKGNIYLYMQLRGNQQIIIQSNKSWTRS